MELTLKDVLRKTVGQYSYITSKTRLLRTSQPVVFVHGAGGASWYWEHILDIFTKNGFACYAPDIIGHGRRVDKHAHLRGINDYAEDLSDFISEVVLPEHDALPIIIGHSMGGLITAILATRGLAKSVILIAPSPPHGVSQDIRMRVVTAGDIISGTLSFFTGQPFRPSDTLLRSLFADPKASKKEIERCAEMLLIESPRVLRELVWSLIEVDPAQITVPMLIIGAEEDILITPQVIRDTKDFFSAEMVMLPDLGHLCPLEAGRERVAKTCLKWLARSKCTKPRK